MARKNLIPYAVDFDGTDDYVSLNSLAGSVNGTATVEFWINRDHADSGTAYRFSFIFYQTAGNQVYMNWHTSGFWRIYNRLGGVEKFFNVTAGSIPQNVWTHFALSWQSGGTLTAYVNGAVAGTVAGIGTPSATLVTGRIASNEVNGQTFDGRVAQFRHWNKALNATDIALHATNARDITSANTAGCTYAANCIGHYPMDVENGAGTLLIGITGRNGTFKGSGEPAWSADPVIPASRKPIA